MATLKELTPDQQALIPSYVERFRKIGLSCEPINVERAAKSIRAIYKATAPNVDVDNLPIWFARSLLEGMLISAALLTGHSCAKNLKTMEMPTESPFKGLNQDELQALLSKAPGFFSATWGNLNASWVSVYAFAHEVLGYELEHLDVVMEAIEAHGPHWAWENGAVVCDRPSELHFDNERRLHNANGPAIMYRDGSCLYAYHGIRVPKKAIFAKTEMTAKEIAAETNSELQFVMIEQYGPENYIIELGLQPVHVDEYGALYKAEQQGQDPLAFVRVVNPTPYVNGTKGTLLAWTAGKVLLRHGPNETYRDHWIPVRPDVKTAKEAVASTWGLTESEFNPMVAT